MQKASPGAAVAPPALASSTGQPGADERVYPDKLDAVLLRIAGVCGLACIMAILDNTVVAVAQRTFIAQFGSTQTVVSWTIAGYMLAFATVIPITGWAADRFGTKRLFMGSVLSFTVGSLLCAIAPNILLLIIFRVVQGIGGGMLMPLSWVILTREAGPKRVGRLMAIGGIPILLGPIGGPILGGWLIDSYGWKWIFLINVPIGIATFFFAAVLFTKDRPAPSETLDVIGLLLLSPGVAIFLCGVSSIPSRHTISDRYVLAPGIIGLTLIIAFVVHAWRRSDHPLIDLRLFKYPVVSQVNVTLLVFAAASVGATLLIPSYFQLVLQQTPMQSGMHLVPVGLGALVTLPIAGAFMDKHGPGTMVLIGLPTMAAGLGIFTWGIARQADYSPTMLAGLAITGLGVGCTTTPLSAALLQSLAPAQVARATTLITVNQQLGGSVGAALVAVVLTNQFNRNDNIIAASKLPQHGARPGTPVDPSALPHQAVPPDLANILSHGLSHAFTVASALTVALVVFTLIPAAFLPRKRPEPLVISE